MRRAAMLLALGLAVAPARGADEARPPLLDLRDGDRVVFLGDAVIERGQAFGYLETRLTAARPNANVEYRNLGWSGDTVFGEARARFGTAEEGFKHLREHVAAIKPTVLIVGYGGNESFAGEAGLPAFRAGYGRLLDALQSHKPRQIILLSPIPAEDLGRPLPDPAAHNRDLAFYRDAIRAIAVERSLGFVDLFAAFNEGGPNIDLPRLTDDGIHPNSAGYWFLDFVLSDELGIDDARDQSFEIDASKLALTKASTTGALPHVDRFRLKDDRLPVPPKPGPPPGSHGANDVQPRMVARKLTISNLAPGRYLLRVDGADVTRGDAEEWARGVEFNRESQQARVEELRRAIVAKNQLYFYRWRPQNETYLFGFRKHEQGQNGREIPQFDPLVAAKEAEIAKLRVPAAHTYEVVREGN